MKTKCVFDFCGSFLKIDLNCDQMLPMCSDLLINKMPS